MSKPKQQTRAGGPPPAHPDQEKIMMPAYATRTQTPSVEGIAVTGEAVRRVAPERAEFLIEITAAGATGAQALHNHQTKTTQIVQAVSPLGVQHADLQTVSLNVINAYAPVMPALPQYAIPQIGPPTLQPDVQFGAYQARSTLRVNVREAARAGEIADALIKTGASLASGLTYGAADEAGARKAAIEAAGKDARSKAETLAATAGKKLGEPIAITEDILASNGVYSALRAQAPWAFGPDTPSSAGDLEYYARVTASFRFQ